LKSESVAEELGLLNSGQSRLYDSKAGNLVVGDNYGSLREEITSVSQGFKRKFELKSKNSRRVAVFERTAVVMFAEEP
jgi:hypothetical protein